MKINVMIFPETRNFQKVIEHGPQSSLIYPQNMVILYAYVSLPIAEGIPEFESPVFRDGITRFKSRMFRAQERKVDPSKLTEKDLQDPSMIIGRVTGLLWTLLISGYITHMVYYP